jgi:myo-inositol 2-dehydrogenase/D-chiro-inositol 1-dehydrogenase
MASDPVRIALVGAGRMGSIHLGALQSSEAIELAAVVEPVAARREELSADGIQGYASVEELLDGDAPEGVLIAAPSDQHAGLVSIFAAAGVPMLCEKPLGVHASQAAEAARIAQNAGVLLQVGYWRRFAPELQALRERVRAGELGLISQLSCLQWDHELPSESFRAHSGGVTVDMGVHEFDQTRWLLGQEFEWVSATAAGPSSVPRDPGDPDAATLLGQLSGGAAVTVSLGRRFPHADSCWLEIWGTEGYERVPFMWDADGDEVFRSSMRRQAEAFARATRAGEPEGAGALDAVAALAVAEMAAQSLAADGAQVRRAAVMAT